MKALIDFDILLHEIGWSSEFKDKDSGEVVLMDFDHAIEQAEFKIGIINAEIGATEEPIMFLSDSKWITDSVNRERRLFGGNTKVYIPNFRYEVAKTKPYKATRKQGKPFHFNNLIAWVRSEYQTIISEGGIEADDELGIYQTAAIKRGEKTTICSRDKDLRMVQGNHYTWECGRQHSVGPEYTNEHGRLVTNHKGKTLGYGNIFFYYQMLTGDIVDNIPGLQGCGPVAANKILQGSTTTGDSFLRVRQAYKNKLGVSYEECFIEQARLLWILRERGRGYEYQA